MSTFRTIWNGLDWSILTDALFSIIPALLCITLHELSHGFVAYRLGDRTAKEAGRLTLNPIRHIDIFGLLMMVVFGFGWAKPVPVNMSNFKNPKTGMAITALAGPVSNMVLAVLMMIIAFILYPFTDGEVAYWIFQLVVRTAWLSIALGIFNIVPIPPLDGSKVVFSFLSDKMYYRLMRYERYGMLILLVVVWTGVLGEPLSIATESVFYWMWGGLGDLYSIINGF